MQMTQIWDIVSAVAGAGSLILAVYVYFKSRTSRITEEAKLEVYKERLHSLNLQTMAAMHSIDAIVQLAKQEGASVAMLQNLARLSRGQLFAVSKQLEQERENLKTWRFGQMIESQSEMAAEQPVEDLGKGQS